MKRLLKGILDSIDTKLFVEITGVGILLAGFIIIALALNLADLNKRYDQALKDNTDLSVQINEYDNQITALELELENTEQSLAETARELDILSTEEMLGQNIQLEYVGDYYCTAYCCEKYPHICGTGSGKTASGAPVMPELSVAVSDLDTFPFGTIIYIEDVGIRVVQDTGSFDKSKIDVAVDTHTHALHWEGQGKHKVFKVK